RTSLVQSQKSRGVLLAMVGDWSNSMEMFYPFIKDQQVSLYGVEAGGRVIDTQKHAAALTDGTTGILHGTMTHLLQNNDGQINQTYSISAGLDYPGVGPEHSYLYDLSRLTYTSIHDQDALEAFQLMSSIEGIIPSLESAHAVAYTIKLARSMSENDTVVICLSGRGDKDVDHVKQILEAN